MLKKITVFLLMTLTQHALADSAFQALDDADLANITGQQGVLLNLALRNNVDASNTPIGCTAVVGTPNPCRFGLEFAANAGTWLMLKEFYGTLQLKDLRLDTGFMPAIATGFQDYNRFKDSAGTCLLAGSPTDCNPAGQVAIKASYPSSNDAQPALYDDVLSFLNIGRAWLEYTCSSSGTGIRNCATATEGNMRDTSLDSVFGVRMSDSRQLNEAAHMRFRGTAYVFGF